MIEFLQQTNLALGSQEKIKDLAQKDCVKILLVSDSHGSYKILHEIIDNFGSECDALCFCGDGMTDLLRLLESSHTYKGFQQKIPPVIFFVQGNGDNSTYSLLTGQRIPITVPQDQTFVAAGKIVFMTHGHRFNVYFGHQLLKKYAVENNINIVFYGHTHIANVKKITSNENKISIMNPGSCSVPRGGLPQTFAVVKIEKEKPVPEYNYFEMKWDSNGEVAFVPYTPPAGDVKLIW